MLANPYRVQERRGIVLVVILGMLALLALIGITFATYSGQARISARNFASQLDRSPPDEYFDFALSQLVGDTNDFRSAIRGHSLGRDMFGSDASNNGYLPLAPDGSPFYITGAQLTATTPPAIQFRTNILTTDARYYGYNFTRWILRVKYIGPYTGPQPVAETYEVLLDDNTGSQPFASNYRVFTVSNPTLRRQDVATIQTPPPPAPPTTLNDITDVNLVNNTMATSAPLSTPPLSNSVTNYQFQLDGRYLRAFNGGGVGYLGVDGGNLFNTGQKRSIAQYANFRYNGNVLADAFYNNWTNNNANVPAPTFNPALGDPNDGRVPGMDEDYDAVDLENWFLAMQSGDGQVVIPSFHRPGILTAADWSLQYNAGDTPDLQLIETRARSKILRPRAADGHDAATFRNLIPNAKGKIDYDVDNDADGQTDSVWLDLGYPARRNSQGLLYKPLFAFLVIGLNGRIPLNTAGNLASNNPNGLDHATHLGNSPTEIDPSYGLQNAFIPVLDTFGAYAAFPPAAPVAANSQVDNVGVDVRLTQMRNLLTGTRPLNDPATLTLDPTNGDINVVMMGNKPYYIPNGIDDSNQLYTVDSPLFGFVYRNTSPVAGRWGEEDYVPGPDMYPLQQASGPGMRWVNSIRAGISASAGITNKLGVSPPAVLRNLQDDNVTVVDLFPFNKTGEVVIPPPNSPEDLYDATGSIVTPVERMRRFVTPIDINGNGRVTRWNTPLGPPVDLGADLFGRVEFRNYFRPPGVPGVIDVTTNPFGMVVPRTNASGPFDITNNLYHGYESFKIPNLTTYPAGANARADLHGGMPATANLNTLLGAASPTTQLPTQIPTYDDKTFVSDLWSDNRSAPGVNEADEQKLYEPSRVDAPFGPTDLEWLYRHDDVDGSSLTSRLSQLAPISFTNTIDGPRRRRLYSLDSWDLNRFAWSADNRGFFPLGQDDNARFAYPYYDNGNNIWYGPASAGFATLGMTPAAIPAPLNSLYPWALFAGVFAGGTTPLYAMNISNAALANPLTGFPVQTPALAQGDRRINLNYPLPLSNNPDEQVRKKWIYEAYQLAKAVLPPMAVDTPQELAQLSQYLVNVIDFRDTDGTCTHFVNPDVVVTGVTTAAGVYNPPTLAINVGNGNLEQYGMEYSPVALNEVLAYSYARARVIGDDPTNAAQQNRLFVELVNVLTDATSNSVTANASQLDMSGWQMVILPDDARGRPDPVTGQLPVLGTGVSLTLADNGNTGTTPPSTTPITPVPITSNLDATGVGRLTVPLSSLKSAEANATTNPNYFYVISNPQPPATVETVMSPPSSPTDVLLDAQATGTTLPPNYVTAGFNQVLMDQLPQVTYPVGSPPSVALADATKSPRYFWLYLLRPANPFLPIQPDRTKPAYNPAVVADTVRFPYIEGGGFLTGPDGDNKYAVTKGTNSIYSVGRLQPFRGGQVVPTQTGATPYLPQDAYGYSEQLSIQPVNAASGGLYGADPARMSTPDQRITNALGINHSIGAANIPAETPWTYFPFNDRDFTSVAELMLVPGCPPGLFTKKFIEFPPPLPGTYWSPQTIPLVATLPAALLPINPAVVSVPQTHPYLVDNFFYTGAATSQFQLSGTPPPQLPAIGGPTGSGWYKLFEFFEVPSSMFGAIGPVAEGTNFDWARQDLRPGLVNLNLIIDEEVFFSVMGKQNDLFLQQLLNFDQIVDPLAPKVVTQIDVNGSAAAFYAMHNVGMLAPDPLSANAIDHRMKAAFAQFLYLRHGGSGFAFGYGNGQVGQAGTVAEATPIPAERPFRSLSNPDINATVLRPFSLPPSRTAHYLTPARAIVQVPPISDQPLWSNLADPPPALATPFIWDPGIKNPYGSDFLRASTDLIQPQPQPPPIPARRLFQIPDSYSGGATSAGLTPRPSNASEWNVAGTTFGSGDPYVNTPTVDGALPPMNATVRYNNGWPNLFWTNPATATDVKFGTKTDGTIEPTDRRQHPYFRNEMMQRVLNLTTVRTHQYAVWVTVGFFEVKRQGDPAAAATNLDQAFDILGPEVGRVAGNSVRHRAFFIIDRTKLVGFDTTSPGRFRETVVYQKIIE